VVELVSELGHGGVITGLGAPNRQKRRGLRDLSAAVATGTPEAHASRNSSRVTLLRFEKSPS